tara:strand:+ start:3031 stop:3306 length:276 start_codon:yes stop_codon:yes gene_type:complete
MNTKHTEQCPTCGHTTELTGTYTGLPKTMKKSGGKKRKSGKKADKKSKKRRSGKKRPPSKWMMHVKSTRSQMKGFSLKDVLKAAAKTYKKG